MYGGFWAPGHLVSVGRLVAEVPAAIVWLVAAAAGGDDSSIADAPMTSATATNSVILRLFITPSLPRRARVARSSSRTVILAPIGARARRLPDARAEVSAWRATRRREFRRGRRGD